MDVEIAPAAERLSENARVVRVVVAEAGIAGQSNGSGEGVMVWARRAVADPEHINVVPTRNRWRRPFAG